MVDLEGLPAAEPVSQGLADLAAGERSVEALWLMVASGRLRRLGLPVPRPSQPVELELYQQLSQRYDDPYHRYNSLRRDLTSFLEALEARAARHQSIPRPRTDQDD